MISDKADEVVKEHFQPLLSRYEIGFEISVKDSNFKFDCVH